MEGMAGKRPALAWAVNISAALLVLLWLIPTVGLFVTSFRDKDQIIQSGWWNAFFSSEQTERYRTDPASQVQDGALWVIEGVALPPTATEEDAAYVPHMRAIFQRRPRRRGGSLASIRPEQHRLPGPRRLRHGRCEVSGRERSRVEAAIRTDPLERPGPVFLVGRRRDGSAHAHHADVCRRARAGSFIIRASCRLVGDRSAGLRRPLRRRDLARPPDRAWAACRPTAPGPLPPRTGTPEAQADGRDRQSHQVR